MINQENSQSKPNNPKAITFPEGKIIDTAKLEPIKKAGDLDLSSVYESIPRLKNIKAVAEVISYSLEKLPKTKDGLNFKQSLMAELFINYKYEEFVNNPLLTKYKIVKLSPNEFKYTLDKIPYVYSLKPKIANISANYNENTFLKIEAIGVAICAAIKNNHITTAEELIRDILKTADLNLSVFKASNYSNYNECTKIIASLIDLLELEPKIHAFQILEKHWQLNFDILTNFSKALITKEHFDKVIELLEPKLANIEDTALEDPEIGNCYFNLAHANNYKMKYQLAKKYYLNALKYLPNDQITLVELFKIYSAEQDVKNATNTLNKLPTSDIKNILQMSLDLRNITLAKFKSINKNLLPNDLKYGYLNLEYIAKFNENKFSELDKVSGFKKLIATGGDYKQLLSTAIYTKQYDFAKEIIAKMPTEEISQSILLFHFKALCQIENNPEASEFIIDQNNLQGTEAAGIINTSSTALIAEGKFTSIPEKVENALKYDNTNEETLEIGVAAALLNNNKEKAKEYFVQLSEEKQQEIAANYSKDNKAENIEELVEQYDPKEIHAQYQQVKQQKLFEISQKITNNQIVSNWEINKQKITKNDVTFIGKYKGLNCFAKIAEKIKDKLGNNLITPFTKALEKGITYCKTSINGVKFLQNKAAEVKIDGGMRLYTDKIHKNSDAELLIDFDYYGNHKEVENFANSHKLEIIGSLCITQ